MGNNLMVPGSATSTGTGIGLNKTTGGHGGGGTGGQGGVHVLDRGGIVTGPRLAALAMDGRPEAVIPLDRLGRGGIGAGTTNIYVTVEAPLLAMNREQASKEIAEMLYDHLKGRI